MAYTDRKNRMTKADIAATSQWANRPAPVSVKKISEEQRRLWSALNEYIRQHGGFVVSLPFASPMRVEVIAGS